VIMVSSSASLDPRHPVVDNSSRTTDLTVTATTNMTVVSADLNLGAKSHGCEVTASAEVQRTMDHAGVYIFSIGLDGTTSTTSSERRMQFVSTADIDVIWEARPRTRATTPCRAPTLSVSWCERPTRHHRTQRSRMPPSRSCVRTSSSKSN
jgi:hypothetical protein